MNKLSEKILVGGVAASMAFASFAGETMGQIATTDGHDGVKISISEGELGDRGFATDPGMVISTVINIVFVLAAIITLFFLIMGAISWITSGGDKTKTEAARNRITAAVIGLLLLGAAFAIFQLVLSILGQSQTDFIEIDKMTGSGGSGE